MISNFESNAINFYQKYKNKTIIKTKFICDVPRYKNRIERYRDGMFNDLHSAHT